jgi:hypothetical protein
MVKLHVSPQLVESVGFHQLALADSVGKALTVAGCPWLTADAATHRVNLYKGLRLTACRCWTAFDRLEVIDYRRLLVE